MIPTPQQTWVPRNGRHPDDSVQINSATVSSVSYYAQGGGFQQTRPLADFLADYRPVTPDEMNAPRYRLAFFSFDVGPTILAWTTGHRWNGWGCPVIERSVLERFIQSDQDGVGGCFRLNGDQLTFDNGDGEPGGPVQAAPFEHGGRSYQVFDTSGFGLCWNQLDPEDLTDSEQSPGLTSLTECRAALCPPNVNNPLNP